VEFRQKEDAKRLEKYQRAKKRLREEQEEEKAKAQREYDAKYPFPKNLFAFQASNKKGNSDTSP